MNLDVRTKTTIEEGIKLREDRGDSTFLLYAPGNGTKYAVLIQRSSLYSPELKDRLGLGVDGDGWIATYLNGLPMVSMVVADHQGELLHWKYVREKLKVSEADAVVLAELLGHVTGRTYIPSEEFLRSTNSCYEGAYDKNGHWKGHQAPW